MSVSRSPPEVVSGFNKAWAAGDVEKALACVADDGVFHLNLAEDAPMPRREAVGRAAIASALTRARKDFDYILYRPLSLMGGGDVVRFQVEFIYRHRKSGEVLCGRLRMVMHVRDGSIVRAEEFHDCAKVGAFLRLVEAMTRARTDS